MKETFQKNSTTKPKGITLDKVKYSETSRGVAYRGNILMDNKVVGVLKNEGNGGYTTIDFISRATSHAEFRRRMIQYFNSIGMSPTENVEEYSLEYTFAEHMLDLHESGKLDEIRDAEFSV